MFAQCEQAVQADKTLSQFFATTRALVRASDGSDLRFDAEQGWGEAERELAGSLERGKVEVHAALCDNVDTPRCVKALLVRARSQPPLRPSYALAGARSLHQLLPRAAA